MSILKKWIDCVVSFIAGVLGLSLSACTGMKVVTTVASHSTTDITKAFKVITDSSLYTQAKELDIGTQFVWMKVFAIITLVASVLLIVYSIVALLQNVNVIKSSHIAFDIVGISVVAFLLIDTIGLMITSNIYADAIASKMSALIPIAKIVVTVGVYQIAMLIVSIITAITYSVFTFLKRKSA